MTTPSFLSCLPERVGPLGTVGPYALSQMEMDIFTALAGDLDPLHNDPEWAPGQAEFGGTIAAGTQSLSRLPWVLAQLGFPVRSPEVAFRPRGLPRVRFISPVPADTGVIVESELVSVEESDAAADGRSAAFWGLVKAQFLPYDRYLSMARCLHIVESPGGRRPEAHTTRAGLGGPRKEKAR